MIIDAAYTFDDVLLQPAHSTFGPADANVNTFITKDIKLNIPLLSAAMDTVTEHSLAITMAQLGGIGVLHKNFTIKDQATEVKKVKKFEAGMVVNPVTIKPDQTLGEAFKLMEKYKIKDDVKNFSQKYNSQSLKILSSFKGYQKELFVDLLSSSINRTH